MSRVPIVPRLLRVIRRHPTLLILLAMALSTAAYQLWFSPVVEESPTFRFGEVRRGDLEFTVTATGTVTPLETVEVGTQVSGTLQDVLVDHNDRVTAGQLLALVDSDTLDAIVREARAAVERASARRDEAEIEHRRNQPLLKQGYLTAREFLPLETARRTAQAEVESASATLERAEKNRRNAEIRSPMDGIVIKRNVDAGQTVAASLQAPQLFLIAQDLSRMRILTHVDETDVSKVVKGQNVRFSVAAHPERSFEGRVTQIRLQPATVQNVVHYTVVVEAENPGGLLLPGMTATADFIVDHVENALLAPTAALNFRLPAEFHTDPALAGDPPEGEPVPRTRGAKRIWYLDERGQPESALVRVGASNGFTTAIQVIHGSIAEGTQVLIGMTGTGQPEKGKSVFSHIRGGGRS
jgi:HlyD family secretion protein